MSEEQFESKRERQKARRAERLEREAQQAQIATRKRYTTYGIVVVLVVALIGFLIYNQIRQGQEADAQAERAAAKLQDLGCTEDARMADLGGGHIPGDGAALAAEPPEIIYAADEPPSSGRHLGSVVPSGVFDVRIDPRFTTHNLEHGYVVAWYAPEAPEEEVAALKTWAEEQIDGDFPKIVVAEYYKELPDDANVAFTAWFFRQACEEFDVDVAQTFLRTHYDTEGEGPERGIPSHTIGSQGVVDPEGEDLFLPPLDAQFGTDDATDEAEDAGDVSPETDPDTGATEGAGQATEAGAPTGDAEPTEDAG